MKIGELNVGDIFLAPMAGVSEVGFRKACKLGGADLTYTEMINSKAIRFNNTATKNLLLTSDIENPVAVQLFGSDPADMAAACACSDLQKFDIIDLNFGCPAPKIIKNGDGSALLQNLPKIQQIVTACVQATDKPITAKIRTGFNLTDNVALSVAKICEDSGIKAITIHGRTREQMYSGEIDYETIAKVKANVKIPVIGNGNVFDEHSYNVLKQTGVDGILIARGALGKPWIFNLLKNIPDNKSKFGYIEEHINELRKHFNERYITLTMRKHLLWYINGVDGASAIRQKIATTEDLNEALKIIKQIL